MSLKNKKYSPGLGRALLDQANNFLKSPRVHLCRTAVFLHTGLGRTEQTARGCRERDTGQGHIQLPLLATLTGEIKVYWLRGVWLGSLSLKTKRITSNTAQREGFVRLHLGSLGAKLCGCQTSRPSALPARLAVVHAGAVLQTVVNSNAHAQL